MGAGSFLNTELSRKTSIFGLRLWAVIGICIGAVIVLILFVLSVWLTSRKKSRGMPEKLPSTMKIPTVSKDIREVRPNLRRHFDENLVSGCENSGERDLEKDEVGCHGISPTLLEKINSEGRRRIPWREDNRVDKTKRLNSPAGNNFLPEGERRGLLVDKGSNTSADSRSTESVTPSPAPNLMLPEVSHLGWGHWYTLRDLEAATDGFSDNNVVGEGGYGIVYQGQLPDGTAIAVKNLLNNRGQAEREFRVEVEAIGRVRHKNLVRLLGYCAEGSYRMLVYEYVNNGNLEQWLHGNLRENQSFLWETRMKIMIGTAKGLQYLHEGLEPKVVHRDVKASNILLDSQWNAKISDFGLAKLLGSQTSHVTTRVMGTFGYVAPEYASTGLLNEKSDIYSFGVLLMEMITGRDPVDYSRPAVEVKLVDWLKMMVAARRSNEVLDPRMDSIPSPRALKRALLVALRCVDPEAQKRPKMGQVVHMLEEDNFYFRDERKIPRDAFQVKSSTHQESTSQGYVSKGSPACKVFEHQLHAQRSVVRKDSDNGNDSPGFSNRARQKRYEG